MKNNILRFLACIIVFALIVQPIPTLANTNQIAIFESAPMVFTQTVTSIGPDHEIEERQFELGLEAERQRILEEHFREEGMPVELLSHEYGAYIQEKREYVPPSAEVIAQTKAQVDSFSCDSVTDVPVIECEALVALYQSTNGAGWYYNDNWLVTNTVGTWYGITISSWHVDKIELVDNNLNGSIPPELGNLTNLYYLYLNNNQLSGSIPPELGNLSIMKYLRLNNNQLSGSIPLALCDLSILVDLLLFSNQLSGSIPPQLGNLSNLWALSLGYNQLSGSIPLELGNLSNLWGLELSNNQLSGNIPPELGNLSNLKELYLYSNQLSGSIPPQLGNLSNLKCLYLFNNQLSGMIPLTFTNLTLLNTFSFYDNHLCEPNVPEFLAWKATVPNWQGTNVVCKMLYLPVTCR